MQAKILPSRQQLVERIELQFEYGANFVCLVGESGCGKSYLLETFVSDKLNQHNKAFISGSLGQSDAALGLALIEQLFSINEYQASLTLLENIQQLDIQNLATNLVVIDDAHKLSDDMLTELKELADICSGNFLFLLGSDRPLALEDILYLDIEPLSQHESLRLMGMYFSKLPYPEDPIFNAFIVNANGNPKLLLSWQQELQIEQAVKPKNNAYQRIILISVIGLAVFCAVATGLYLWQQTNIPKQSIILTEEEAIPTVINSEVITGNTITTESRNASNTSPEINEKQTTIENPPTAVVEVFHEPSAPVQVNEKKSEESVTLPSSESASEHHEVNSNSQNRAQESESEKGDTSNALSQTSPVITPPQLSLKDNLWVTQQDEAGFFLQLMAANSVNTITVFIEKHNLVDTYIYQTTKYNGAWFVLVKGPFASLVELNNEKQKLPEAVKQEKPFAKKVSQAQQEILALTQ